MSWTGEVASLAVVHLYGGAETEKHPDRVWSNFSWRVWRKRPTALPLPTRSGRGGGPSQRVAHPKQKFHVYNIVTRYYLCNDQQGCLALCFLVNKPVCGGESTNCSVLFLFHICVGQGDQGCHVADAAPKINLPRSMLSRDWTITTRLQFFAGSRRISLPSLLTNPRLQGPCC